MILNPTSLIRWTGVAGMAGGLLIVLTRVAEVALFGDMPLSEQATGRGFPLVGALGLAGSLLVYLLILGLYARIASRAGYFGLFAFLTAFVGTGLGLGMNWTYAFALTALAQTDPSFVDAGFPGLLGTGIISAAGVGLLGWILMGLSSLRAGVLPRWPAGVLVASAILLMLPFGSRTGFSGIATNALIAAGPAAFGYALWAERTVQPAAEY